LRPAIWFQPFFDRWFFKIPGKHGQPLAAGFAFLLCPNAGFGIPIPWFGR
jgi:hypothetical protein